MNTKAKNTIERYDMLHHGDTVIVGVSGGADSMALLHFLCSVSENYDLKIIAAHVNHGIRGEEALRDELFVKEYCEKNNIELKIAHVNIPALSKESGEGEEECGRRVRYEFFESIDKSAKIATAHTLSDSIETFIFNLSRGTTLKGLCGIPPVRVKIIRPLIECTRNDIEYYCKYNSISFVTDSTNLKTEYSRNKIRLDLIPVLEELNPAFRECFSRCISSNINDENLLENLSNQLLESSKSLPGHSAEKLLSAHVSLRRRAIASIIYELSEKMPEQKHIEMVETILKDGGLVQITNGIFAEVRNNILNVYKSIDDIAPWSMPIKGRLTELPFATVEISCISKKDDLSTRKVNKKLLFNSIDSGKISGELLIRSRLESDSYRPNGRNCTKTLKKLFNEADIPPRSRNEIVILCDDMGIIWVEGFGPDERVAICNETESLIDINIKREVRP